MAGVHWVGELPRDQLAPFMRVLDVGLTPYRDSMFNRRSYPLKTLEYLAAGVPVVTTDVASLSGLDERYVSAADSTAAFSERVEEIAKADRRPSDIRRSVETEGWDSERHSYWPGCVRRADCGHSCTVSVRISCLDHRAEPSDVR